ncbi:hypothetical protein QCE58_23715, partial [Caballeronia sp. LZ028]|nr:hypothetical protein [Caballeronia sp. LZ028]
MGDVHFGFLMFGDSASSMKSCVRGGLLALPLCGAALTFFAAAKKVSKESSSRYARGHTQFG